MICSQIYNTYLDVSVNMPNHHIVNCMKISMVTVILYYYTTLFTIKANVIISFMINNVNTFLIFIFKIFNFNLISTIS